MARKFLYIVAIIIVMVITGAFVLRLFPMEIARVAFVPTAEFKGAPKPAQNAYAQSSMWLARPAAGSASPASWTPSNYAEFLEQDTQSEGSESRAEEDAAAAPVARAAAQGSANVATFFIHPTSYLERSNWNAPLSHQETNDRALLFVQAMASPFARQGQVWAPRYRQAAIGAFLTEDKATANRAFDLAFDDVMAAFDQFLADVGPNRPIILAGHSQGAMHLGRLLKERVAGDAKLKRRIVAVYAIGWPISTTHDLPLMGLPACTSPDETGCILSWQSYAEPADPKMVLDAYAASPGLDGQPRGTSRILCVNPLTGVTDGPPAPASANPGTLKPDQSLTAATLVPNAVPARCDDGPGLLLIGPPPEVGPYVLPGNNYHVYDIPLFWEAVVRDAGARAMAFVAARGRRI